MLMYDATSGQVTHTATPLITGDLAVEEGFSFTPTNKYFEVETGAGNNRIMRSGINMSTFGQSIAPEIDLTAYRASPADGDAGPELTFRASTAGSSNSVIATIETKVIATASGAVTTKVSIRNVNAGTSVTPFTITGNTVYSASHISIADLKILVAAAVDFADYKTLIAAL
jgi:WD40 repeat protein